MATAKGKTPKPQGLSDKDADKQIRQMIDFIKLEAREKANEIRVKVRLVFRASAQTEHDFNIEKQMRVQKAKAELRERFRVLEQQEATKARVREMKEIGEQRASKLKSRDEFLQLAVNEARQRILSFPERNPAGYSALLAKLVRECVERLAEKELTQVTIEVRTRAADSRTVAAHTPAIERDWNSHAASEGLPTVALRVVEANPLPADCGGGVIATTLEGRVVCDNTLVSRLGLIVEDLQPQVRALLFPSARAETRAKPAIHIGHH